eukprot:5246005-Amphidinium_carterae.1
MRSNCSESAQLQSLAAVTRGNLVLKARKQRLPAPYITDILDSLHHRERQHCLDLTCMMPHEPILISRPHPTARTAKWIAFARCSAEQDSGANQTNDKNSCQISASAQCQVQLIPCSRQ